MLASQPDAQDPVRLPLSIGVRPIQRHVIKSTTGDRGHEDIGIEETLLRGDPSPE
jgi:hypothetical protein